MQKINFENLPSTNTPINATNLNAIQDNVETEINSVKNTFSRKIIQLVKTQSTDEYSPNYNYFSPFNGETTTKTNVNTSEQLIVGKKSVSYGDRTSNGVWGINIGSNMNLIKVSFSVRYLNNADSSVILNTIINKVSNNTNQEVYQTSKTVSAGNRSTDTGSYIFEVNEGDFIFLSTWRSSKTADVDTISSFGVTNISIEIIN